MEGGAAANTKAIQDAIDGAGDGDVVLIPAGTFPVETVTVHKKTQFSLRGAARGKTVLRRLPMRWDNNT
jgi:polygalacturonase